MKRAAYIFIGLISVLLTMIGLAVAFFGLAFGSEADSFRSIIFIKETLFMIGIFVAFPFCLAFFCLKRAVNLTPPPPDVFFDK